LVRLAIKPGSFYWIRLADGGPKTALGLGAKGATEEAAASATAGTFAASWAARLLMLTMSNEPGIEAARATAESPTLAVTMVPPSRTPAR